MPDSVLEMVKERFHDGRPIDAPVHERLMHVFKLYTVIGGMPRVCQTYLDSANDSQFLSSDIITELRGCGDKVSISRQSVHGPTARRCAVP